MTPFIQELTAFLLRHFHENTHAILLKGSHLQPSSVDFWSDVDMVLIVADIEAFEEKKCISFFQEQYLIVARERHNGKEEVLLRMVLETEKGLEFLDLSIFSRAVWNQKYTKSAGDHKLLYGSLLLEKGSPLYPTEITFSYPEEKVTQIWFLFFQCVKKIMRKDHLIGMHLLLELVQEYLVIEMMERDAAKGSTIHRIGDQEQLPHSISSLNLSFHDPDEALYYLRELAVLFDQKMKTQDPFYSSRLLLFQNYIKDSLKAYLH